ncbi:MAG: alkaline phosphatase family protein [Kofleriaceae bacterium]
MRQTASTRQVVAAALAMVILGAAGAIQAGLAGGSFMYDLEQIQPALAREEPVIDALPAARVSRRVYVVIVDGLRVDKSHDLPFLDQLRGRGASTQAVSHYPTWSRPNYVTILTGVPPTASGVRTNHHTPPVQLDSLMDRVRAAGMRAAMGTDYDVLPRLFLRRRGATRPEPIELVTEDDKHAELDVEVDDPLSIAGVRAPDADLISPFADARYAPWPGGFVEAGEALAAGDAELVVLLIGAVDAAGHEHGGASDEYRAATQVADRAVGRALRRVDLTKETIVVIADHGHTDRGGHGGMEPEVVNVPLIIAGAGARIGAASPDARLIDVAPTVSALLGIPAPGHALGRTLTELLVLEPASQARREEADRLRGNVTRAVVALAEARADTDMLEHRAARIGIVVGAGFVATMLAVLLIRRGSIRMDVRVLLVSVPAFFIVYVGAIAVLGQRFSPSLMPARGHIASVLVKYGIAAISMQILASQWTLRARHNFGERLAAANGIAWTGLMLTMVPAGLVWAYFPPPYVTLPSPVWLVVIPAALVAVACAAINMAVTLGIEIVVFIARAWQRDRAE